MKKGNELSMGKKYITVCIFISCIVIILSSIIVVKTYLSHANRWHVKSGSLNTTYNTHAILSQNLASSVNNPDFNKQSNEVINMLEAHSPDIVCFQEASSNIIGNLATYFTGNNYDVVIKYADECNTSSAPIFYNSKKYSLEKSGYYWLSDTPNILSVAWTENKPYIVTWAMLKDIESKETFGIVNVNLSKDLTIQSKSLECIMKNCETTFTNDEYILCGTFNFTSKDQTFNLIDGSYNNLSVLSNKLYNVGPTTTNETESLNDDYVYDYFFGTKKIKCDRYAVLKDVLDTSNGLYHYGVMSNIYFEEEKSVEN